MDSFAEAYREQKTWEKAMGVGTMDKMFDAVQGKTPDYDDVDYLDVKPEDHNIDFGSLSQNIGMKTASVEEKVQLPQPSFNPTHQRAIERYPSLVEMLGSGDDQLADVFGEAINFWIVGKVQKNSQSINKHAIECKEEDGGIKQYFQDGDQAGFVKAAGKFSGDEFIHYDKSKNQAYVLTKNIHQKFDNVSTKFEIEFHFVETTK